LSFIFFRSVGFGESSATHDRPYLIGYGYQQSTAVIMAAAAEYLALSYGSCTTLHPQVAISGASEGGYASIWAGITMAGVGWNVSQVHAAVPPLNSDVQTRFAIASITQGQLDPNLNNYLFQYAFPFNLFSYSNHFPYLPNTGSDQSAFSTNWTIPGNISRNVLEWYRSPDPLTVDEILSYIPEKEQDLVNLMEPKLLQVYLNGIANNITEPCKESAAFDSETSLICQAMYESSLWGMIRTTNHPIQICYSLDDTVIGADNYPSNLFDNALVTRYDEVVPRFGFSIQGDHATAIILCGIGLLQAYTDRTLLEIDPRNDIVPLSDDLQSFCRVDIGAATSISSCVPTVSNVVVFSDVPTRDVSSSESTVSEINSKTMLPASIETVTSMPHTAVPTMPIRSPTAAPIVETEISNAVSSSATMRYCSALNAISICLSTALIINGIPIGY
jgi:hypothetical protein